MRRPLRLVAVRALEEGGRGKSLGAHIELFLLILTTPTYLYDGRSSPSLVGLLCTIILAKNVALCRTPPCPHIGRVGALISLLPPISRSATKSPEAPVAPPATAAFMRRPQERTSGTRCEKKERKKFFFLSEVPWGAKVLFLHEELSPRLDGMDSFHHMYRVPTTKYSPRRAGSCHPTVHNTMTGGRGSTLNPLESLCNVAHPSG